LTKGEEEASKDYGKFIINYEFGEASKEAL